MIVEVVVAVAGKDGLQLWISKAMAKTSFGMASERSVRSEGRRIRWLAVTIVHRTLTWD